MSTGQRSVAALDALLFRQGRWFAIDAGNQRVARVVVPTLETGLGLVGDGPVASIVGRIRDEVLVVDVDVPGEPGHAIVEQLARWCSRQGLWNLVRPSGGAPGRAHLFVVHEGLETELRAQVAQVRTEWGVSSRAVDARRDVRPLSAPHRGGGHPRPLGQLVALVQQLRARLASQPGLPAAERPSSGGPVGGGQAVAALAPRPRRVSALPVEWERFLRTGVAPGIAGEDQSRSAVEAVATGHLLRAGHTASSAWQAIGAAHPQAMTKARAGRRRWVAWVWNPAVRADLEWASRTAAATRTGEPRATGRQGEAGGDAQVRADGPARAVEAAREALGELQWAVSPRRRPAVLLIGHSVLDRMERTGSVRVPVPERDLVLDTGVADRKTIRACLRLLAGSGTPTEPGTVSRPALGVLHRVYDPKRKDASSFEFEIATPGPPPPGGVREIPPPRFHTPGPGTWAALPPLAHSIWRALIFGEPRLLEDVATGAGIPQTREAPLTRSQLRTTTGVLEQLAAAGLARCDAQGRWSAAEQATAGQTERAASKYAALTEQVAAERAVFRAASASGWDTARAAAAKTQRAKEQAWWNGLPRAEQVQRRARYADEFARLPVTSQEHAKTGWAAGRVMAGADEAARHDAWLDQHSMDQVITRSVQRAARFAAMPPPLQQAHAAAWRRHREKFGIARGTPLSSSRLEHATALPDAAGARDAAFLHDQRQPLPGFTTAAAG